MKTLLHFLILFTALTTQACGSDSPSGVPEGNLLPGSEKHDAERQRLRDLQRLRTQIVDATGKVLHEKTYDELVVDGQPAGINEFYQSCRIELGFAVNPPPPICDCNAGTTGTFSVCLAQLASCMANKALEIVSLRGKPLDFGEDPNTPGARVIVTAQSRATEAALSEYALVWAKLAQGVWVQVLKGAVSTTPPTCLSDLLDDPLKPGSNLTVAEAIGAGYADNYRLYKEAVDRFVETTLAVADWHFSTSPSSEIANGRGYAGAALSRSAAAHRLVGGDEGLRAGCLGIEGCQERDPTTVPLCTAPEPAKGVQAAIDVFRTAAVSPADILDNNLSLDDLIESTDDCGTTCTGDPNGNAPLYSVRERLAELWGREAELLSPSSSVTMTESLGLSTSDFKEAREYLAQEIRAFSRTSQATEPRPIEGTRTTFAPTFAGTHTPPPQRPPQYGAALARYREEPLSPGVEDAVPIWSLSNLAEFVDYSVSHASIALSRKLNVADAGVRSALLDPIALLVSDGSKERFGRLQITHSGSQWDFVHYGGRATDGLRIVAGEDGLACATSGNIEGAPCNVPMWTVTQLSSEIPILPDSGFSYVLFGNLVELPLVTTQRYYLIRPISSESTAYEPLIGFWLHEGDYSETIPIVPDAERRAGEIMTPSRKWCARPAVTCNGFSFDARIPLEDELADDENNVESSWKHYVELARRSAQEADALGDAVIEAGTRQVETELVQAQRAEVALEELQDICGVDIDPAELMRLLSADSKYTLAGMNTTVACTSDVECGQSHTEFQPKVGYKCHGGHCIADPIGTVIKNSANGPFNRLWECLGIENTRKFVTPGAEPVCVWTKNGVPGSVCADNVQGEKRLPCPDLAKESTCTHLDLPAPTGYTRQLVSETLGYFDTQETDVTANDVRAPCDYIRRLRGGTIVPFSRPTGVGYVKASDFFHYANLGKFVPNVSWEARFGSYSAVTLNGTSVYATGNPWTGASDAWPCADWPPCTTNGMPTPGACGCESSPGLFCAKADCSNVDARARMNDRLMRATLALRLSFRSVFDDVSGVGIRLPWRYLPHPSAPEETRLERMQWKSQRTHRSRAQGTGDPIWVVQLPQLEGATNFTGYSVDSVDAEDKKAWGYVNPANPNEVQFFYADNVDGSALLVGDFYWGRCGLANELAVFAGCGKPWYAGLSSASPKLGPLDLTGYFMAKLSDPAISISPSYDPRQRSGNTNPPAGVGLSASGFSYLTSSNNPISSWPNRGPGALILEYIREYEKQHFGAPPPPHGTWETLGARPLDDAALLDGLELACELGKTGGDCSANLPPITGENTLGAAREHLKCAADRITRQSGLAVFANIPARAVDALRKESKTGAYPALGGRYGQAVSELRASLVELSEVAPLVAAELRGLSDDIESLETSSALSGIRKEIADVQFSSTVANQLAACGSAGPFGYAATCANAGAQIQFAKRLANLSSQEADLVRNQALIDFRNRFSTRSTTLQTLGARVTKSSDLIDAKLAELETLRSQAERALAKVIWDQSDVAKRQAELMRVAQARFQTNVVRYEAARDNAVRMAFMAKRAIETRLGVRLSEMREDLPLVEAPFSWEADVCMLSGVNFDEVKREGGLKDYANQYIGDYVTKLENVVESYRIANNFHEGTDTAVISLRDDWLGVRAECDVPVDNLVKNPNGFTSAEFLAQDADPNTDVDIDSLEDGKWALLGCREQTLNGVVGPLPNCVGSFPLPDTDGPFNASTPALGAVGGYRLGFGPMDGSACEEETCGFAGFSFPIQFVTVRPGLYRFSYYARDVSGSEGLAAITGRALDWDGGGWELIADESMPPQNGWTRYYRTFRANADTRVLVLFGGEGFSPKQVDVAAPMLESQVSADPNETPKPFADTGAESTRKLAMCEDTSGEVFRRTKWKRSCVKLCSDGFSESCDKSAAQTKCFWETSVTFNQRDIDAGRVFGVSGFAQGNFNYRIESVGLNVVGTGVRDCSSSQTPSSCFGSGYATYSMVHGGPYFVRNHEGADVEVQLFTGRIEHARALAAERYVTNPLSTSDQELMESYLRGELRGRPLDGTFAIRIWEEPTLKFDAIQDVQLVMNYRYWTRFN